MSAVQKRHCPGKNDPAMVREVCITYELREASESPACAYKDAVHSPSDIAELFMDLVRPEPREVFYALYLNGRNGVLYFRKVCTGTPNQAVPHIRDIMTPALAGRDPASGLAVIHNHPSGNTTPSREDKRFTESLRTVCDGLDIRLIDHIIIAADPSKQSDRFFSFAEGGHL